MKSISPNSTGRYTLVPNHSHTADAIGNPGVVVVSTPHLISFLEIASNNALLPYLDEGEATVGTRVSVDHVAAAMPGRRVVCEAIVTEVRGRRVEFQVAARQDGRVVMQGSHQRAVVRLEPFLERLRAEAAAAENP